ncbi:hypothetical protein BWZ20_11585 [Winogradskyella sp. J14-2]|uniref:hypothetical protein n=1 Tax=Winogradskyella sp. J14-2 TaxID=1936080 RepID=UPI0009729576|nr:hypothetical protein [Winogradskyella sp. J14-2]APY08904.1 hypothetical protein BWZ20_11585 [Winogradskyella sp. J14-2]
MTALKSIIDAFSVEDQQKFTAYLQQKNKRKDTKNIELFRLMTKPELDSKSICYQLYKVDNCNAYHALRKRLFQSLIDFTANKNLEDENSIDMQIIKYILASRTYLLQKNYEIAYKILDKAERLADEHLLFPILNEIYHTKIQYAPNYQKINLDNLIFKQRENRKKHILEDQLNIVYAQLKSVLNSMSYQGKAINFEAELESILKDYSIELSESLSFKSLYQILAIVNISALATNRYYEIENFVLKSYNILKDKKDTEKQLFYQIQIVYIIANTLFRNKKFEASLSYITEMEELMKLKKGTYQKEFILKKTLVEALNYNYLNNQNKAIDIAEQVIKKKHSDIEALLDLHLSLLMFHFQKEDFSKAKSVLAKFYHTDQYYIEKAGIDWVIKKNLAEILLYIELNEDDLFYSRLKSFKRKYTSYLKQINQSRILSFVNYAERLYQKPETIMDTDFSLKLKSTFESNTIDKEDIFVISFYAWLKNKTEDSTLYNTTLNLINS